MASSRRKQDDKHVKVLRDLVSKPANRTCFDCHQKGPTYINMTIGSFVCTSCSGILRGLNPPHRVKSISMASFTSEEVEQIKSRGNQYCQAVWLGLYDGKSNLFPDTKDEHKIRDFMISKYEKKRFYVDPAIALKNGTGSQSKSESSSSASTPGSENRSFGSGNTSSLATVSRPAGTAVQVPGSSPSLNGLHQSSSLKQSSSIDLLSPLGNNSVPKNQSADKDPFSSTTSFSTNKFADFDNASIFSTDDSFLTLPSTPPVGLSSSPPLSSSPVPSSLTPDPFISSAFPSNPHPLQFPNSSSSNSPSQSPSSCEGYEDELSAAMPLIPTGELPPTYQSSQKEGNTKKTTGNSSTKGSPAVGSPALFAAGFSAQYVTPSIDIKTRERLAELQAERASSLPLSLSDQFKNKFEPNPVLTASSSSYAIDQKRTKTEAIPIPRKSMEDYDFSPDEFEDDLETDLSCAMPLLSVDPLKRIEAPPPPPSPVTPKARKYERNLSVPVYSFSEEEKREFELLQRGKGSSSGDLSSMTSSGFHPSPKSVKKVMSYNNLFAVEDDAQKDEKNAFPTSRDTPSKEKKKTLPRQLSAISHKIRARLMSNEDLPKPKNKVNLSSSLPNSSPLSLRRSSDLANDNNSSSDLCADNVLKPVVVHSKSGINQASFFTNLSSDFQSLGDDGIKPQDSGFASVCSEGKSDATTNSPQKSQTETMDKWTYLDKLFAKDSCNSDRASNEMKAMHGSLPSLSNLNNVSSVNALTMTKVSNESSNSMANLTNIASHFVAGASISKPTPPNPHPSFYSNPLTPLSSSNQTISSSPNNASTAGPTTNSTNPAFSQDRYAALKDLDEAFKIQKEVDKPPVNNSTMFGSPTNGQTQAGSALFGTSPGSGGAASGNGTYYSNTTPLSNQGWNATFPSANPFSGNGTAPSAPVGVSPWPNGSQFGSPSTTQVQAQSNPFAGGADPNFNNQCISGFGAPANSMNGNWSNFGNPANVQNSSKVNTNPWGPNSTQNPFNAPPVVQSGGPSFNPFL